jgi:hypothetical protein
MKGRGNEIKVDSHIIYLSLFSRVCENHYEKNTLHSRLPSSEWSWKFLHRRFVWLEVMRMGIYGVGSARSRLRNLATLDWIYRPSKTIAVLIFWADH